MSSEGQKFLSGLRQRFFLALEVLSILIFDSVILGFGYLLFRYAAVLVGSRSILFDVAKEISAALFLLLYLAWVAFDFRDFLKRR